MLKISDYIAVTAGFFGIFVFYLIFSGNLALDYGTDNSLPEIERAAITERQEVQAAEYVVLYGNEIESGISIQVMQMLDEMKKAYIAKADISGISREQLDAARVFIITAKEPGQADQGQELLRLAQEEGKYLFYTCLAGEDAAYEKELGVLESRGVAQIDGMMIFEGLMVQGMVYYDSLPMEVRDIALDAACTKMIQEKSKRDKEQRLLIPLLWKKQYGSGRIYCCNGPFFSQDGGTGIFAGALADMEEVFLHPVVNAGAVLLDYYPDYENSDRELIQKLYSRDPVMFVRDIIWPAMDKIGYMEGVIISGRSYVEDKNDDFYDIETQMKRSRGIILENNEGSILPIVCEGHMPGDEKRWRMESFASGMGLATSCYDMREIMGSKGEDPEYEWAAYSRELSKNIHDIYRNNQFLDAVNWQEAQERFKRYEKIQPAFTLGQEQIHINAEGFVDVWYCMVRTDKELHEGPDYKVHRIGEDAYLLEIRSREVTVEISGRQEEEPDNRRWM
ncbi:MAG: DUF2194 domain-containing protein [Lachnospiraceae bacterium]|nr:DUF2194 domain-containing protein [Lachnospiraceae bacterium]